MTKYLSKELIIGVLAGLLFIPFLGNVHLFDWDEINFAECAREMYINKDYGRVYINFMPFWEKPPLFFWLQVVSMHIFGVNDFAARFPNAICGIVTLITIFQIGKRLYSEMFGIIWALVFAGSILPQLYFHSGIIDPWFNLFIFLSLYFYIVYFWKKENYLLTGYIGNKWFFILYSGIFLGLALITKGPAALLIFGLTVGLRWAFLKFRIYFSVGEILVFLISIASISMLWYGYEYFKNGSWFIKEFLKYNFRLFSTQDAGHGGFPGYHFVVLLVGCFPASLFFIHGHYLKISERQHLNDLKVHLVILFWVVLILFSIVQSKIVHYSSLCYFPLTFIASLSVFHIYNGDNQMPKWLKFSVLIQGIFIATVVFLFPFIAQDKPLLAKLFSKDAFALANLETKVDWLGWEWFPGAFAIFVVLVSFFLFAYNKYKTGISVLFGGNSLLIVLILWAFIGKIEAYTQGTAVDFFKSLADKDCYVLVHNYKSFAPYYYARVKAQNRPRNVKKGNASESNFKWTDSLLLSPNTRKDVYVLTKFNRKDGLERYPELTMLWEKNGWVAYMRKKPKK